MFCAFSSVLEIGASGSLDWNVRCGHASEVVPRSTQWQYKYWMHAYGCLHVNAKAMSVDPLKLGTLWGCLHLLWLLGIALHLLCYLCYDCLDMLSTQTKLRWGCKNASHTYIYWLIVQLIAWSIAWLIDLIWFDLIRFKLIWFDLIWFDLMAATSRHHSLKFLKVFWSSGRHGRNDGLIQCFN